jgi:hypothetical protein
LPSSVLSTDFATYGVRRAGGDNVFELVEDGFGPYTGDTQREALRLGFQTGRIERDGVQLCARSPAGSGKTGRCGAPRGDSARSRRIAH